jgi:3' terminal RNA ribose 2'-O-methyltransferase Hen1
MLLTITTTYQPAADLGYLLHKHPQRVQSFDLPYGQAHVFYPEAAAERCTAALLLDVNPVGLVRRRGGGGFPLEQYVNDRPYVASSFLSVAIAQVYGSALNGVSRDRAALASTPLPLQATVCALRSRRGGESLLERLFAPLGYTLTATRHPLDPRFPDWGDSPYYTVSLAATATLQSLLTHLYVLLPVLDDEKHYYVGMDEVQKLLHRGEGWLAAHPERKLIADRYLRHQYTLAHAALAQLLDADAEAEEERVERQDAEEATVEASARDTMSLHDQRLQAVVAALQASGAQRVLDLGCGEGRLLALLLKEAQFSQIVGMDVSHRALEIAADRLRLERMPPTQRARIELIHGSLLYRDPRLNGFDAAAVVEVVEHLDPPRLAAFERVLFEFAQPRRVVLTTPNIEYNIMWPSLPAGKLRHRDHRFEWTRAEFQAWAARIGERFGYRVQIVPIGPEDAAVGVPSQMGIFDRG